MTGFTIDSNIVIDALAGFEPAKSEIRRAAELGAGIWISRVVWIEVMSKGATRELKKAAILLSGFAIDELDSAIGARAAALRRERVRLKSPDAVILATALVRGRILVTRNTKDFPATMPGIRVPYIL